MILQDNHENYDELNLRTIIKILPWLLLLAMQLSVAWFSFQYFGAAKYKAMELAKNPNNIRKGCAFYQNDIKGLVIKIDNYSSALRDVSINKVPYAQKSELFKEDLLSHKDRNKCYKVKYLVVKVFFTHRYFIYDVELPK